jgi:putative membrane protein
MKPLCYFGHLVLGGALICLPLTMAAAQSNTGTQESNAAQSKKMTSMSTSDKTFVREAAEGGLAEVQLGQLAEQKASNPEVKKFAERMVQEQVATRDGITLPKKLDAKDEMLKTRLEKLSGPAFDRTYMQNMVTDHRHDIAQFEHEDRMGHDNDVREFAAHTLPTLKSHLQEAEKVAPQTRSTSTTGGSR